MGNIPIVTRVYPSAPPACLQCADPLNPIAEGGWVGVPSIEMCETYFGPAGCTPMVSGADSAFWIVLYVSWGISVVIACAWWLIRSRSKSSAAIAASAYRRRRASNEKLSEPGSDTEDEGRRLLTKSYDSSARRGPQQRSRNRKVDPGPAIERASTPSVKKPEVPNWREAEDEDEYRQRRMTVEYFSSHRCCGVMGHALLWYNTLLLLACFLLLCFDFYLECENNRSFDDLCFFGTFRVFGNYQRNSEVFFVIWTVMFIYYMFICVYWREILDWIRLPSTPEKADRVRVWMENVDHVVSTGRPSWGMRLRRWIAAAHKRCASRCSKLMWGEAASLEAGAASGRYETVEIESSGDMRYFVFECVRYRVPGEERISSSLASDNMSFESLHKARFTNPLTAYQRRQRLQESGRNEIALSTPTWGRMVADEFLSPFYAYQIMVYLIWIWWTYWFVGVVLFAIVILSGAWTVYLKRRNVLAVHALAAHHDGVDVLLSNEGGWTFMSDAKSLVPGDVVRVKGGGWTIPADLVLMEGSCAVDESGLTGESVPRPKTALPPGEESRIFNSVELHCKPHALFAGTKVLEASQGATALVVATGVDASRGRLLSHVLFPPKTLFRFDEEFSVALGLLLIYAILAFALSLILQNMNGSESTWTTIWAYGIMTVSQIVSPMIKLALVVGQVAASKRLENNDISVLDTHRIDIAGKVKVFCFDKTGTLTKEGLDFLGARGVVQRTATGGGYEFTSTLAKEQHDLKLLQVMVTCHSLGEFQGRLLGSAVEISLFRSSGWSLAGPDEACSQDASMRTYTVRRFAFDQARRTMSVVARVVTPSSTELGVFVKGAPEAIVGACVPGTVPENYLAVAEQYASQGCYVLGLAGKPLLGWTAQAVSDAKRDELERQLIMYGIVVFRNEIKPDTAEAIAGLKRGDIRVVMITGDNAQCGVYVSNAAGIFQPNLPIIIGEADDSDALNVRWREMTEVCGGTRVWSSTSEFLEDLSNPADNSELVVTGRTFDRLASSGDLLDKSVILHRIRVFARTNPVHKVQIIRAIMDGPDGVVCAMAGDGGNDSGALRAAHVGISMGTAEASVVAPFSSRTGDVMSAHYLMCEGRASLATSLASYKLLVVYGLLFSIVKMCAFYYAVLMSMMGYILIDLVAVVPLTFAISLSPPLTYLNPSRPTSSLLGPVTVSSVVGVLIIATCSLAVNLSYMASDPAYVKWPAELADTAQWWTISDNWESCVIFFTVFYIFITAALGFSFGSEHRASVFANWTLVITWALLFILTSVLLLTGPNDLTVAFHTMAEPFDRNDTYSPVWQRYQALGHSPIDYGMSIDRRWALWSLSVVAALIVVFWERAVVFGPLGVYLRRKWTSRGGALGEVGTEVAQQRSGLWQFGPSQQGRNSPLTIRKFGPSSGTSLEMRRGDSTGAKKPSAPASVSISARSGSSPLTSELSVSVASTNEDGSASLLNCGVCAQPLRDGLHCLACRVSVHSSCFAAASKGSSEIMGGSWTCALCLHRASLWGDDDDDDDEDVTIRCMFCPNSVLSGLMVRSPEGVWSHGVCGVMSRSTKLAQGRSTVSASANCGVCGEEDVSELTSIRCKADRCPIRVHASCAVAEAGSTLGYQLNIIGPGMRDVPRLEVYCPKHAQRKSTSPLHRKRSTPQPALLSNDLKLEQVLNKRVGILSEGLIGTAISVNNKTNVVEMLLDDGETKLQRPLKLMRLIAQRDSGCIVCKSIENQDSILLCDGCDLEMHIACHKPPMSALPEGQWFCPTCISEREALGIREKGKKPKTVLTASATSGTDSDFTDSLPKSAVGKSSVLTASALAPPILSSSNNSSVATKSFPLLSVKEWSELFTEMRMLHVAELMETMTHLSNCSAFASASRDIAQNLLNALIRGDLDASLVLTFSDAEVRRDWISRIPALVAGACLASVDRELDQNLLEVRAEVLKDLRSVFRFGADLVATSWDAKKSSSALSPHPSSFFRNLGARSPPPAADFAPINPSSTPQPPNADGLESDPRLFKVPFVSLKLKEVMQRAALMEEDARLALLEACVRISDDATRTLARNLNPTSTSAQDAAFILETSRVIKSHRVSARGKWHTAPYARRAYETINEYEPAVPISEIERTMSKLVSYKKPECDQGPACAEPVRYSLQLGAFDTQLPCASKRVACPASKSGRGESLLLGKDLSECDSWGIDSATRAVVAAVMEEIANVRCTSAQRAVWEGVIARCVLMLPEEDAHDVSKAIEIALLTYRASLANGVEGVNMDVARILVNALRHPVRRCTPLQLFRALEAIKTSVERSKLTIEIRPKGMGIKCQDPNGLPAGTFVNKYLGEVYSPWRWYERSDAIKVVQKKLSFQPELPDFYNIVLERHTDDPKGYDVVFVDPIVRGNFASRLCHSCDPNCATVVMSVDGKFVINMYTTRQVQFGEELTFDYSSVTDDLNEYRAAVCLCGSTECRGSFLSYAGTGAFMSVFDTDHLMMDRTALLLDACRSQLSRRGETSGDVGPSTKECQRLFTKYGLGDSLIDAEDTPDWLYYWTVRTLQFIDAERSALAHKLQESQPATYSPFLAGLEAKGVAENRVQNLAITVDKIRYFLRHSLAVAKASGEEGDAESATKSSGRKRGAPTDLAAEVASASKRSQSVRVPQDVEDAVSEDFPQGDNEDLTDVGARAVPVASKRSEIVVGAGDIPSVRSVQGAPAPLIFLTDCQVRDYFWNEPDSLARRALKAASKVPLSTWKSRAQSDAWKILTQRVEALLTERPFVETLDDARASLLGVRDIFWSASAKFLPEYNWCEALGDVLTMHALTKVWFTTHNYASFKSPPVLVRNVDIGRDSAVVQRSGGNLPSETASSMRCGCLMDHVVRVEYRVGTDGDRQGKVVEAFKRRYFTSESKRDASGKKRSPVHSEDADDFLSFNAFSVKVEGTAVRYAYRVRDATLRSERLMSALSDAECCDVVESIVDAVELADRNPAWDSVEAYAYQNKHYPRGMSEGKVTDWYRRESRVFVEGTILFSEEPMLSAEEFELLFSFYVWPTPQPGSSTGRKGADSIVIQRAGPDGLEVSFNSPTDYFLSRARFDEPMKVDKNGEAGEVSATEEQMRLQAQAAKAALRVVGSVSKFYASAYVWGHLSGWYKQTVNTPEASLSAERRGTCSLPEIESCFNADGMKGYDKIRRKCLEKIRDRPDSNWPVEWKFHFRNPKKYYGSPWFDDIVLKHDEGHRRVERALAESGELTQEPSLLLLAPPGGVRPGTSAFFKQVETHTGWTGFSECSAVSAESVAAPSEA